MSGSINKHGNFTPGEGHNFTRALSAPSQRVRAQLRRTRVITESQSSSRAPARRAPPGVGWLRARPGLSPIKDLPTVREMERVSDKE